MRMQTGFFRDFADWWLQTASTIKWLGRFSFKPQEKDILEILVERDGYTINASGRSDTGIKSINELDARLASLPQGKPVRLVLAPDRYLRRSLSDRILPASRASIMSRIDIDERMPFLGEDTFTLLLHNKNMKGTDYSVIRASVIEPVLASLTRSRLILAYVCLAGSDGIFPVCDASLRLLVKRTARQNLRRKAIIALLSATQILTIATVAHLYYRNAAASTQLEQTLEAAQKRARQARVQMDQHKNEQKLILAARMSKANSVSASLVWEELTRLLPDTTWLTDLSIRNDQVTITGFASSAADLIPALSASPMFSGPAFTTQVMKIPGQKGERFSIQMRVVLP